MTITLWPPSANPPPQPVKSRQANVRLTPGQDAALKRFCLGHGISTQAAIVRALAAAVDDFDAVPGGKTIFSGR